MAFYSSKERADVEERVFKACKAAGFNISDRDLDGNDVVETGRGDILSMMDCALVFGSRTNSGHLTRRYSPSVWDKKSTRKGSTMRTSIRSE